MARSETFDVEGVDEQLVSEMFAESRRFYMAMCKNFWVQVQAPDPLWLEADIAGDKHYVPVWGGAENNADLRWISTISGTPLYPLL